MTNEIITKQMGITVKDGAITFKNFEEMKKNANKTASEIREMEVTEDNVKSVKKDLAQVRKDIDVLEKGRKEVKKRILEPYESFDKQVKELTGIVKEAEDTVRDQVNELAQRERDEKEEVIIDLFLRRNRIYKVDWISPDDFIKDSHLNKSTTMKTVEDEMIDWFEKLKDDISVIKTMDGADEILTNYSRCFDVTSSIKDYQTHLKTLEKVKEEPTSLESLAECEASKVANGGHLGKTVIIIDDESMKEVVQLLTQNNITFEIE